MLSYCFMFIVAADLARLDSMTTTIPPGSKWTNLFRNTITRTNKVLHYIWMYSVEI